MKGLALPLLGLSLLVAGCGDAKQTDSAKTSSQALVSNFGAPMLQGVEVSDDPDGAKVVNSPHPNYPPGIVFTRVNGEQVRNAAHFRELVNAVVARQIDLELSYETRGQTISLE